MSVLLNSSNPSAEVPLDQEINGGGVLQVGAIDGTVVVEGTADRKDNIWFTIGLTDYPTYNSYQTVSTPGGYFFNLIGVTHIRARLLSGNSATVQLVAKIY